MGVDFNRSPVTVFMTANVQPTPVPEPEPEVRIRTDLSQSEETRPETKVPGLSGVQDSYGREGRVLNIFGGWFLLSFDNPKQREGFLSSKP